MNRREILSVTSAGTLAGLAGCIGTVESEFQKRFKSKEIVKNRIYPGYNSFKFSGKKGQKLVIDTNVWYPCHITIYDKETGSEVFYTKSPIDLSYNFGGPLEVIIPYDSEYVLQYSRSAVSDLPAVPHSPIKDNFIEADSSIFSMKLEGGKGSWDIDALDWRIETVPPHKIIKNEKKFKNSSPKQSIKQSAKRYSKLCSVTGDKIIYTYDDVLSVEQKMQSHWGRAVISGPLWRNEVINRMEKFNIQDKSTRKIRERLEKAEQIAYRPVAGVAALVDTVSNLEDANEIAWDLLTYYIRSKTGAPTEVVEDALHAVVRGVEDGFVEAGVSTRLDSVDVSGSSQFNCALKISGDLSFKAEYLPESFPRNLDIDFELPSTIISERNSTYLQLEDISYDWPNL